MLPNAKSVTTALRKVKDLPYQVIANGHGPLLKFNVAEMVGRWARRLPRTACRAPPRPWRGSAPHPWRPSLPPHPLLAPPPCVCACVRVCV